MGNAPAESYDHMNVDEAYKAALNSQYTRYDLMGIAYAMSDKKAAGDPSAQSFYMTAMYSRSMLGFAKTRRFSEMFQLFKLFKPLLPPESDFWKDISAFVKAMF